MYCYSASKNEESSGGGFSIPELMVVIVILGILATMAVSFYRSYVAKARQAEVKINLSAIESLQEVWKLAHEKYNPDSGTVAVGEFGAVDKCGIGTAGSEMKNELGFRPKNCAKLRYGYKWNKTHAQAESNTDDDKRIYPGCNKIDKWRLTYSNGSLVNNQDVIKLCE